MRIITKLQLFVYHLNWLGGQLQTLCTWAFFFEMIQDGNPGAKQVKLMSLGASVNSRQGQSECAVRSLRMKTIKNLLFRYGVKAESNAWLLNAIRIWAGSCFV